MVNGLLLYLPEGGKICRVHGFEGLNLPGRRRPYSHNILIYQNFPFGTEPAMASVSRKLGRASGETDRASAWECGHPFGWGAADGKPRSYWAVTANRVAP
jgi:hypothetical protein